MNYEDNAHRHYQIVEAAIGFIYSQFESQPTLKQIAREVNVSEYHLQRIFSQWAGISPKRFLQFVTKRAALEALANTSNLIKASQDLGLSGASRLHDLMVTCEAMTPGEMSKAGEGVNIEFGIAPTPFGEALFGWTPRGVCHLEFIEQAPQLFIDNLKGQWHNANFRRDDLEADNLSQRIFCSKLERGKIHLVLKGTNFQVKVWEAMINTEPGQQLSYSHVSQLIGSPKASRAVGTALANNNIGYLIPCHRVIKSNGELGNYRWGANRKAAIQLWENAQN